MRWAEKSTVFTKIYGKVVTFSTSSAPSGHLLLKEKALVPANLQQSDKSEFGCLLWDMERRASVGRSSVISSNKAWGLGGGEKFYGPSVLLPAGFHLRGDLTDTGRIGIVGQVCQLDAACNGICFNGDQIFLIGY